MSKFNKFKKNRDTSQIKRKRPYLRNFNTMEKFIQINDKNVNPFEAVKTNFANSTNIDFRNFYHRRRTKQKWIPITLYGKDSFRTYKVYLYKQSVRAKQKKSKKWRHPHFKDKKLNAFNLHKQSIAMNVNLLKQNKKKLWRRPHNFFQTMDVNKILKDRAVDKIKKKYSRTLKRLFKGDFKRNRTYNLIKYFGEISKTFFEQNVRFPKDGKEYSMEYSPNIGKFLYENVGVMKKAYIKKKKRFAYLSGVKYREEANWIRLCNVRYNMKKLLKFYNKYTLSKVLPLINIKPLIKQYIKSFIEINNIKMNNQLQNNIINHIIHKIDKNRSFIKWQSSAFLFSFIKKIENKIKTENKKININNKRSKVKINKVKKSKVKKNKIKKTKVKRNKVKINKVKKSKVKKSKVKKSKVKINKVKKSKVKKNKIKKTKVKRNKVKINKVKKSKVKKSKVDDKNK